MQIVILLLCCITPLASIQAQTLPVPETVQVEAYPVVLDQKELFKIRAGYRGYSAKLRADDMSRRIKILADDYAISPDSIQAQEGPLGSEIVAGDRPVLATTDEDARAFGKNRQQLAKENAAIIRAAVAQYRIDYSKKQMVRGTALSILATLVFILVFRLMLRIYAKILAKLQTRVSERYGRILEDTRAYKAFESVIGVLNFIRLIILGLLFLIYIQTVLGLLPWTRPFAGKIMGYVLVPLGSLWQGFIAQIPNLFFVAVLAVVTYYTLKIIQILFNLIEVGRITIRGFDPEWGKPTFNIVRILVVAFALVVAFPYLPGSSSPAFKGISVFLGILFSLGSSSAIANVIAGLSMNYRKAYRIGDLVRVGDVIGMVTVIRLTVTHVRTAKNEIVTIPNSQIVNANIINYSAMAKESGLILHTSVTIGYDVPWRQVHALLILAAEKTDGLLRQPPPFVLQRELQDFYIKYELNVYVGDTVSVLKIYSDLHQNIQDAFNEYGVQIMSPNYEADPETQKIVPKDKWFSAPAKNQE